MALVFQAMALITLRVKKSVLDTYKATGKGYQTRMNRRPGKLCQDAEKLSGQAHRRRPPPI
ncbi:BrnA antitoxin family protein [Paracoccus mutanolyticus]|uniref:BrnA antitoxin family protein n=1 Tax=Paracoccus mutanolyticus TaxID=1499308 RepID=UPI001CB8EF35|nr:BrnA antitoxin family protein [Paracoccus mutanolyticus]